MGWIVQEQGNHQGLVPVERIERRILLIRGQKVIVDADLAGFYGVTTKRFNEQVRRNDRRFPTDFMFQLTSQEKSEVVANCDHLAKLKYSKALPLVFTEHGALMAATVLNTPRAVDMSLYVIRAFLRLRRIIEGHAELAERLNELERKVLHHDDAIISLVRSIRQLSAPEQLPRRRRIGFSQDRD